MKSKFINSIAISILSMGSSYINLSYAASYIPSSDMMPPKIVLQNVNINNLINKAATLRAQDSHPLYGGQVFELEGTSPYSGIEDSSYISTERLLIIPKMDQTPFLSYSATLELTDPEKQLYRVNAIGLLNTVVGPQGPKGDAGPAGTPGIQGNTGLAGPQGERGLDGLTVKVNNISPINGNITLTKADIGLGNVDNTSDMNKPISTKTQAELDSKAPSDSPKLGSNYGGGVVFYLSLSGKHGLIAETKDMTTHTNPWTYAEAVSSMSKQSAHQGDGAKEYFDWRLPTIEELQLLYTAYKDGSLPDTLFEETFNNRTTEYYWSSDTDFSKDSNTKWALGFHINSRVSEPILNNGKHSVRAIRSF